MMIDNKRAIVDRSRVEAMAKDIVEFIPGARDVPLEGRLALAHISLAHGLDPFLKEAWAIPVKDRNTRQIIGFELMIGITGWRRTAHESGEYWGRRFEPCTPDERKGLNAGPEDLTIRCVVMRRKTGQQPMEFDGFGIFRKGELSKMNPLQCVRLRAERDALKAAFPISLAGTFGARVRVVDEESGEIIDGEYSVGGTEASAVGAPETEPEPGDGEGPTSTPAQAEPTKPAAGAERKGNGKRSSWPAQIVKDVLAAGLAENVPNAIGMLNKSQAVTPASDADMVMLWARAYRVARDEGCEPDEAAARADEQLRAAAEVK